MIAVPSCPVGLEGGSPWFGEGGRCVDGRGGGCVDGGVGCGIIVRGWVDGGAAGDDSVCLFVGRGVGGGFGVRGGLRVGRGGKSSSPKLGSASDELDDLFLRPSSTLLLASS